MKRTVLLLSLFLAGLVFLSAQDAAAIVQSSRNRIKVETTSISSRMEIVDRRNNKNQRDMLQYSKDGPNGHRIVIAFQRPARVADTRFLTMAGEKPGDPDQNWIFLPSNNRARRIAATEGSASFMSSDFSYDDIAAQERKADLDTHTILREEALNGRDCYVIESVPKDSSYQYGKMVQWIDKGNFVNYKIELYNKQGVQVKLYEVLELKDVQGRLSPWKTKMSTLRAGTYTTLEMLELQYDVQVPEGIFSIGYLETGKF